MPPKSDQNCSPNKAPDGGIGQFFREQVVPNLSAFWRDREPVLWLLALMIGTGAGYAALAFRHAIGLVQYTWLNTSSEYVFMAALKQPWWIIMLAPTLGGLLVGLFLHHFMPGRRAQGAADVIEAQALLNCKISPRVGLSSALISAVSLGSGASAGREGPMVHLGATLASFLVDRFKLPGSSRRILLASGVAAAVSASFNVPLAGVLFAHEVILGHYALRAFVPIAISSVMGALVIRTHLGNFTAFNVPDYNIASHFEFPAFALLGLVCALVAIAFQFSLIGADKIARQITMPLWLRPAVGGLAVGGIGVFTPQILGVGYDTTFGALTGQFTFGFLVALVFAKMLATSITLASRFGGGIFSPSLYLGAMTGGAFGIAVAAVFPFLTSAHGLYAVTGMGAVAGAILGAPISTTLIAFELTGDYSVTIALLLAVSIATALHRAVHGMSFFHWQLGQRGLSLTGGAHRTIMRKLCVSSFCTQLEDGEIVELPDEESEENLVLRLEDNVGTALRLFDMSGKSRIPVVDESNPACAIGWAERVNALDCYNKALIEAHEEEHR